MASSGMPSHNVELLYEFFAGAEIAADRRKRHVHTAALVAVVYPLLEGRQLGWPAWVWLVLGGGVVTLAVLGLIEERRRRPQIASLLRTPLFRIPAFTAGLAVQLAFSVGLRGLFLTLALWLQTDSTSRLCGPG